MNIAEALRKRFKTFDELKHELRTEKDCMAMLEYLIWEGIPVSPFDKTSKVYKCKNGKYKCKNTGKYFTVLVGSPFENTKVSLKTWFYLIYLLVTFRNGISSYTAAKLAGVTQKTAWRLLKEIRKMLGFENYHKLSGTVEADELVAGGLLGNMHLDKKKQAKTKPYQSKIPIIGMAERGGDAVAVVIPNMERDTLCARVLKYVEIGSTLYTDENPSYEKLNPYYKHDNVVHSKGNYVKKGTKVHTNSIESFWNTLSRTLRTYIHVSGKYLQEYVNEVVFRYNTRKMKPMDVFIRCLLNITINTKTGRRKVALG